jgi:hypothetical protein
VGHDGTDTLLVKAQHVGNDRLLARMKDTGFGTLAHQDFDFVISDR